MAINGVKFLTWSKRTGLPIIQFNSIDASSWLNWKLCNQRAQLIKLIELILQQLQLNSTDVVVSNYYES